MCNKDLFFRNFGNGKPIVILHGILGSSEIWVPTAKILSAKNRVIIPDLPNHGNSLHTNSLNYDYICDTIVSFLKTNNIDKPIVIGHSYGGKIALNLVAKKNIDIEKIVLIDITSEEQTVSNMEFLFDILAKPLPHLSSFAEAKKYFYNIIDEKNMALLLLKGLKRTEKTLTWKWNANLLSQQYTEILKPINLLPTSDVPLLLISGERSDYVSTNGIELLKSSFKKFSHITIPDAGHWVHTDNFDELIKTITAFVG